MQLTFMPRPVLFLIALQVKNRVFRAEVAASGEWRFEWEGAPESHAELFVLGSLDVKSILCIVLNGLADAECVRQ